MSHTTGVGRIPQALEGLRPDLHRPNSRGQIRWQRLPADPGSRDGRSRVLPFPLHLIARSAACWRKSCGTNSLVGDWWGLGGVLVESWWGLGGVGNELLRTLPSELRSSLVDSFANKSRGFVYGNTSQEGLCMGTQALLTGWERGAHMQ